MRLFVGGGTEEREKEERLMVGSVFTCRAVRQWGPRPGCGWWKVVVKGKAKLSWGQHVFYLCHFILLTKFDMYLTFFSFTLKRIK